MENHSIIEKLGFKASDKVVIFHIDDMGVSHSINEASFECLDFGVASCGSVISPSSWLFEAASICKNNPKYDIGVHLTLTCEYDLYRWRALSTIDSSTGLLDSEGCLWRTSEEAIKNVTPKAAEIEMKAQVQRAIDNGIDVTHIDTHMGTVMDPKFLPAYLKIAREFQIPAFLPRVDKKSLIDMGMGDIADVILKMFLKIEASGFPIIDHMIIDTMDNYADKVPYYCNLMAELKPGLTHFLFHPGKLSSELKAIAPDSAEWRDQDYRSFTDSRIKDCVEKYDLKIIGYRKIREYFRNQQ
ncbi:MAG: ChbG/HpnK family deacetylase [Promethearchaeota archaeon]|nr:MAG: ChbG/HpnK family deacetylase [Candidatus Lokiarchaeota archaeon]